MLLSGKSCIITGGGSGIGAASARHFAKEGARLCLADLDLAAAEAEAAALRAAGAEAFAIRVDVTEEASVRAMVEATVARFGQLDGALNNAGVGSAATGTKGLRAGEIPREAWERMIGVNLTGVWLCMKQELAAMTAGGAIVNTAFILGHVGTTMGAAYVAAKHGVVGLSKAAALDYAKAGIRINALCPGYVETPMIQHRDAAQMAALIARQPMGRLAQPLEIAAAAWLLSDHASYTTGAALLADGGYTAA